MSSLNFTRSRYQTKTEYLPTLSHMRFTSFFVLLSFFPLLSGAQHLGRYSCIVDRVDVVSWEADTTRNIDENGILKMDSVYHPVSIGYYGIMCLDKYVTTGDESYLNKATDQVGYFKNSALVHSRFDGNAIGLPYEYENNGLRPPWYSGMAQGLAISFLLRYSLLTQDTSLLPIVQKLAYLMLMPQEEDGCLSRTDENLLWNEEYPNTPESPQVLNGFIFSVLGLIDYCQVFPMDLRAKRILEDCLLSLKTALPYYDLRSWTKYNRRPLYPNRLHYIRLQIFQLIQLYRILPDPFYLRQICIWSAMIYDTEPDKDHDWVHFNSQIVSTIGTLTKTEIQTMFPVNAEYDSFEMNKIESGAVAKFPWYGFVTTEETEVEIPKTLVIEVDSLVRDVHILFRYHWDEELFENEKWQAQNGISSNQGSFHLQPGHYQFAIFYRNDRNAEAIPVKLIETINP